MFIFLNELMIKPHHQTFMHLQMLKQSHHKHCWTMEIDKDAYLKATFRGPYTPISSSYLNVEMWFEAHI